MKRIVAVLLMTPALAFGVNPTPAQVDQTGTCFDQILTCAIDGKRYVNASRPLLATGTTFVLGSTTTFAVPQTLIDEIVGKYQDKKAACVAAFNLCP